MRFLIWFCRFSTSFATRVSRFNASPPKNPDSPQVPKIVGDGRGHNLSTWKIVICDGKEVRNQTIHCMTRKKKMHIRKLVVGWNGKMSTVGCFLTLDPYSAMETSRLQLICGFQTETKLDASGAAQNVTCPWYLRSSTKNDRNKGSHRHSIWFSRFKLLQLTSIDFGIAWFNWTSLM